jgi:hypothetical protein
MGSLRVRDDELRSHAQIRCIPKHWTTPSMGIQGGPPCMRADPLRGTIYRVLASCAGHLIKGTRVNFKVVFTLSNLCILPLAINRPRSLEDHQRLPSRADHMLACHNQCRHTETVIALTVMNRVQNATKKECRSREINEKNGRHHAQHRCYLGAD